MARFFRKERGTPWLLVVLAQQRSGTAVLRHTLGRGRYFTDYAEVFHDPALLEDKALRAGVTKANYFIHRLQRIKEDPERCIPTAPHQRELWDAFVTSLRETAKGQFVLIDIKYNSWHHLDGLWRLPLDRPLLADWLRSDDARVVHLIRRDLFAQACSNAISIDRHIWHVRADEGARPADPVRINPAELEQSMRNSARHTEIFRSWFSDFEHYVELAYEELLDGNVLSPRTYQVLEQLTGLALDEGHAVPFRKTVPRLRDEIENCDEVLDYFAGGEFEQEVRAALN